MDIVVRIALIIAMLVVLMNDAAQAAGGAGGSVASITIGQPFRIYPSGVTQTETFITRHPHNHSLLFASANTINPANGFISEGVYVSTNGGQSWRGSDTCNGALITAHKGDPGIAIDKNGTFLLVRLGSSPGLYGHFSTNNGVTWAGQRTIANNDQDRATLASDGDPASPFYGRSYTAWVRFAPPYPVYYSRTDDGGATWSTPTQINAPTQRSQGAEISIGPGGRINLCWAGVINTSPFTEDYVGFATSTNGGASWTITEVAFDINGIQGVFPQKTNIRVNGLPKIDTDMTGGPRNGWIYIVTTQRNLAPAGSDPDIIIHRSTNNGQSWLPGIRVNTDPINNGKAQFFPAVHVDNGGGVNVLYYDDRNTTSDSAGVYLARSTDGGETWTDYRITNYHFKPTPIGGLGQGYQGDNIAMTSSGNILWPVWMDNSTGLYQAWTAPVTVETTSTPEEPLPFAFSLEQNYPNPFNPTTQIRFSMPMRSVVSLKIYDLMGKELVTILEGEVHAGRHEKEFSADALSTGVYFYRLTTGAGTLTRKMVVLK